MQPFLVWLEATSFSVWMRESTSILAFPAILAVHTIGMGFVAGISAAVDLRVLGLGPDIPAASLRRFFPALWLGFWVNFASGVALLVGYPTKALTNPVFYLKLLFIVLGVALLRIVARGLDEGSGGGDRRGGWARAMAVASLVCWAGAIFAGRLLAYTHTRLMANE
jgi:hypothetical protein